MRILLLNTTGSTSFNDLRTFNGILHETYQQCAIERGLMADDKVWDDTLKEAALVTTDINKFRLLFVRILIFASPSNPKQLYESYKSSLAEDILFKEKIRLKDPYLILNQSMFDLSLFYLDEIFQTYNKSLKDFYGLPQLPPHYDPNKTLLTNFEKNKFLREHTAYDKEAQSLIYQRCKSQLNKDQLNTFNMITSPANETKLFFIDGPGGTGKTFLYNTLLAKIRSEGKIGIAVATSGIAANLL